MFSRIHVLCPGIEWSYTDSLKLAPWSLCRLMRWLFHFLYGVGFCSTYFTSHLQALRDIISERTIKNGAKTSNTPVSGQENHICGCDECCNQPLVKECLLGLRGIIWIGRCYFFRKQYGSLPRINSKQSQVTVQISLLILHMQVVVKCRSCRVKAV